MKPYSKIILNLKKIRFILLPCLSLILFLLAYYQIHSQLPFITNAQQANIVNFGAVGDSGGGSSANAVFSSANSAGLNFFLHLGDMRYSSQGSPAGWATWIKSIFGSVFPFEIVTGNHDDQDIDAYVAGLPDHLGSQGQYGKNYYFDYPQTSPLIRVIMISPGMFDPDRTWLTNAIDSARANGIKWIAVGMHYNAVSTGSKSNSIGDTLQFLISKKVDLVLQGHDHNYQRSKQLSCVKIGSVDQACIVKSGSAFTKDTGTVLIIAGNGGNGFYGTNSSDSEAGYFDVLNSDTYGYVKFTITSSQLTSTFIKASGGNLADSFTISGQGTITTPPPISSATPTGIVPSFVCLGACPSVSPTIFNPPQATPTSIVSSSPAPSAMPQLSITPNPTTIPIPLPTITLPPIDQDNGLLIQLLELIKKILELIQQLLGITIAPPALTTLTLNPTADAYVASDSKNKNYGDKSRLHVDGKPKEISYLKFDLPAGVRQKVISAKLKLRGTNKSRDNQNIKIVSDSSWDENKITYKSRPSLGQKIASFKGRYSHGWTEIDLTSSFNSKFNSTSDNVFSIGIDSSGSDGFDFYSKDTRSGRAPILELKILPFPPIPKDIPVPSSMWPY